MNLAFKWNIDYLKESKKRNDFELDLKIDKFIFQILQFEDKTSFLFEQKLNDIIQLIFQLTKIDDQKK